MKPLKALINFYNSLSLRFRRIILTAGSTSVIKIINAGINFLVVPLTISYLGSEKYGFWMMITSMISMLNFADLGLGNGLLNSISKSIGLNRLDDQPKIISSVFFLLSFIALFFIGLLFIIEIFFGVNALFDAQIRAISEFEIRRTIFGLIVIFFLNVPLGVVRRVYEGYQEGYKYQFFQFFGFVFSIITLLISIKLKAPLFQLVILYSLGPLLSNVASGLYLFTFYKPFLRPRLSFFDLSISKRIFNEGLIFFTLGIFSLIANASDNLIIFNKLGPDFVTEYEIVRKLFMFTMFTQFIIQPLWPAFSEAIASEDYIWVKKTLYKMLKMLLLFGGLLTLPFVVFGKQIISIWVGTNYIPSYMLLVAFFLQVALANFGGVMSTFLNSSVFLKKQVVFVVIASSFSFFIKIFFIEYFGILATAWSNVIAYSLFYVVPSLYLANQFFKRKIR